jgi:PhoPQ-activated pathogenicity-related protein
MDNSGQPQINSQRGFVTLFSNDTFVTTSDANITANSIIMITPYGDITQGGTNINSFWVSLNSGVAWTLNLYAVADPSNSINFAYNILQY